MTKMSRKKQYQPQTPATDGGAADLAVNLRIKLIEELGSSFLKELASFAAPRNLSVEHGINFYDEVRRFEIEIITSALKLTGGHQREAAKLLKLKCTTLNSKIKHLNIPPDGSVRQCVVNG